MFNFFKSKAEQRQEQIAAYIDQQMSQAERSRFEASLKQDADLQAGLDEQREVQSLLSRMPKLKAPRNFVLDPAVYGGKAPAPSFAELLYPKMRVATAAASFLFVILLGAGFLQSGATSSAPEAADIAAVSESAEVEMTAEMLEPAQQAMPVPTQAVAEDAVVIEKVVEVEAEVQQEAAAEAEMADAEEEAMFDSEGGDTDEADDSGAEEMAESAAAPVPPEAEAGAALPEADAAAEAPSPRVLEPADLDGERVGAADSEILPESTASPVPIPTIVPLDDTENLEVADAPAPAVEREAGSAADGSELGVVESPPLSSAPWGTLALWLVGVLALVLIAVTLILRRQIDW